jgi:Mycothiol maleylpyruvate isomerase N-terminal domain/MDMPI C-terminal domain
MVYLHKVECMRRQKEPEPWPPADLPEEPALARLDRAYGELTAEFAARKPEDTAHTWYEPDQTVGFWIRRMAQETVIHRVDAEQALGEPLAEIPEDLALDGIDEVLERFLAYGAQGWPGEFEGLLPSEEPAAVGVRAAGSGWLVRAAPNGVWVERSAPDAPAAAGLAGVPDAVLLWLWRRADSGVTREGDLAEVDRLHAMLRVATQ